MLLVIAWGAPNPSHPFPYHMDEWHQLEAIRNTFKHGSPNIPGSAHGSMLQFILSGFYLGPFVAFRIIDLSMLKSTIMHLDIQERLFVVLRINTLLFGIGTLFILGIIGKKYFKIPPSIPVLLLCATPIWISLSNYFKYDIALVFWVSASLLLFFAYAEKPTRKNFIFCAIVNACALATKVAALPLIPLFLFSFFLFTKKWQKKVSTLFIGIGVFSLTFLFVGIPDIFLPNTNYGEYFSSNLITGPQTDNNYILGMPLLLYVFLKLFPPTFGYLFYSIFCVSIVYWSIFLFMKLQIHRISVYKKEIFLFVGFVFFLGSLIPLGLGASGNRLLVLLPFLALLSGILVTRLIHYNKVFFFLFFLCCVGQIFISSAYIYSKLEKSPQQITSDWLRTHVKRNTVIGLENIPIYQNLPEIALKEFYELQYNPKAKTYFSYQVIDAKTVKLPEVIIITEPGFHQNYLKTSPKKDLLIRLDHQGYKAVAVFYPNKQVYALFGNDLTFHLSGLNAVTPISIYQKN